MRYFSRWLDEERAKATVPAFLVGLVAGAVLMFFALFIGGALQ